ncbi:MAG TPA: protein phosphatase 2C domain-containing protein [Pyrinomonadaceae bacterium]|nr:protein phosphatase 2C domain-containing protein [Pyrinomonadaceae bacterium]
MTEYNFQIDSAAVSDRGLSQKRPQNEDSFLEIAERGIFSVADGVGGAQAGEVASQMAMEILGEAFVNTQANSDAEELMQVAITQANSSIYQMSRDLPQLSTMATTIVALHVSGNIATIGHVGDSRLYRLDGNGNLYRETQDHSVVEEEVRAGRMTPAQAANHPSRNVISRALGAEPTVEIDMKTIMFEPQTSFLLCSDGITRHVDDFEIRQLLLMGGTPTEICEELKKLCYERGAEDNLTAIVVKISKAVAPVSAPQNIPSAVIETEEQTVATPRVSDYQDEDFLLDVDENDIPTQNLVMPQAVKEANIPTAEYPTETPVENYVEETSAPVMAQISQEPAPVAAVEPIAAQPPIITGQSIVPDADLFAETEPEKPKGGGFFGKLFGALLWLLLGAAIGAGGFWYWTQMNKQAEIPPQLPVAVDPAEAAVSTFEKSRRTADDEPTKYIEANKNEPPNAEKLYLLGRAALLNHNFSEAAKYFKEAQTQLSEVHKSNQKTLKNDINLGLAIATSEAAQTEFKKQSPLNSSSTANTNSANTKANTP